MFYNLKKSLKIVSKVFAITSVAAFFLYVFFVVDVDIFLNSDYISFLTGAKIVSSGKGGLLYDFQTQLDFQKNIKYFYKNQKNRYPESKLNQVLPYRNLPFIALFFTPFTLIPAFTSFKVFLTINLAILMFFLIDFKNQFFKKDNLDKLIFISFMFLPVLTSVVRGQLTLIALLIFYLIYKSLKKSDSFCVGVLSGILLIKIQYLFALPFLILLAADLRKFSKGFVISSGLLFCISLLVSGSGMFQYPRFLFLTEQAKFGSIPSEILTFFSVLNETTGSFVLAFVLNIIVYSVVFIVFVLKKSFLNLETLLAIIILSTVVFGVHMTDNDIVLLLFPIFLILREINSTLWNKIFVLAVLGVPLLKFTRFTVLEVCILLLLDMMLFRNVLPKIKRSHYE